MYSDDSKTKLDAKGRRKVLDKDAQTACSTACSTNALVFGDVNDEQVKLEH